MHHCPLIKAAIALFVDIKGVARLTRNSRINRQYTFLLHSTGYRNNQHDSCQIREKTSDLWLVNDTDHSDLFGLACLFGLDAEQNGVDRMNLFWLCAAIFCGEQTNDSI